MAKKKPTKAESRHMERVVSLGCVACINMGYMDTPSEFHHTRANAGGGQKSDVSEGLPLCPIHHRTGGPGVALHAGIETWQDIHGTEMELLEQVRGML